MISVVEMLMGKLRIPSPDQPFSLMEKIRERAGGGGQAVDNEENA